MGDLIPVPAYGRLYEVTLLCRHVILRTTRQGVWWCGKCQAAKFAGDHRVIRD